MDQPTYERIVGEGAGRLGPGELVLLRKVSTFIAYDIPTRKTRLIARRGASSACARRKAPYTSRSEQDA